MTDKQTHSYGSWPSPISIDMAVGASRGLGEPRQDGDDLYFLESRPDETGRVVLLRRTPDGTITDMAPHHNVRTRVHEYGGGAWAVRDGIIAFSGFDGNGLWVKRTPDVEPHALVSDPALRFADMEIDTPRDRIIAVLEDQRTSAIEARNLLVAVSIKDATVTDLATGHDFFSDPRLSPDGSHLAWLCWDFPQMPWDGTDLWVAPLDADGSLGHAVHVAGGANESILQPKWAPDGSLLFVSDRSEWWNLYRWRADAGVKGLAPMDAEVGGPAWVFGLSAYDIDVDGTIVAFASGPGGSRLVSIPGDGPPRDIDVASEGISYLRVTDGTATYSAQSPRQPTAIVRLDLATGIEQRLREASILEVDPDYLSMPELITFPSTDGRSAYAWFYAPTNRDVQAPAGELPPLVVMSHGGPTSKARTSLSLARQAFTSRGIAVADVDYGGSTGYGRTFREELYERWGQVDVDDCSAAALWLAEQGLVDRERIAIRGGSAGGYTTLATLCFRDVFAAGVSEYGLGDLEVFTKITHKFESRYMDNLVGPYPAQAQRYRERSPNNYADRITCPVLVMQGADDKVVPPSQAEGIVAALRANGLPHAYVLFEGEGHGFRQSVNQRRALEAELSFYAQVFGFELADDLAPLEIVGLSQ